MSSSSTIPPQIPLSSSLMTSESQAWQKRFSDALKPKTPAQIKATGDIKIKLGVLLTVGTTCAILAFFGCYIYIKTPEYGKDLWLIISPIITAGITGPLAFLTGEKTVSKK